MQLLYRILYNPFVNSIILGILKMIPNLPEKFKIPPSGIITLTLNSGKTFKLSTNQTCSVTREVFWKGTSQYEYSDIFEKLFKKADVFFDIGANIGYYSAMAGVINPKMKIYAFDPSPGPYAYLDENARINKLPNMKVFQLALSNENGQLTFQAAVNAKYSYLKHNSLGGSGHIQGTRVDSSPYVVTVNAITLDNFVREHQVSKIDIIKLDVEEAEHLVVMGGIETFSKMRPLVVCEVFSNEMWDQIKGYWKNSDYLVYIFDNKKLVPTSFDDVQDISKIENYFFVPKEKNDWLIEFIER